MVIFQYNLYIFVWIKHGCLTNTVNALDPNNGVIKRLWCIFLLNKKKWLICHFHNFNNKMGDGGTLD